MHALIVLFRFTPTLFLTEISLGDSLYQYMPRGNHAQSIGKARNHYSAYNFASTASFGM